MEFRIIKHSIKFLEINVSEYKEAENKIVCCNYSNCFKVLDFTLTRRKVVSFDKKHNKKQVLL